MIGILKNLRLLLPGCLKLNFFCINIVYLEEAKLESYKLKVKLPIFLEDIISIDIRYIIFIDVYIILDIIFCLILSYRKF